MKRLGEFAGRVRRWTKEKHAIRAVTMTANYVMALAKFVLAAVDLSYFIGVYGLYSLGVGLAKTAFFRGKKAAHGGAAAERKYFGLQCAILAVSSILYIVYMVRLFFLPDGGRDYGVYFGIAVAAVSFAELGVAIGGLIRSNRRGDLLMSGMRCVNLTSALTSLAFTQVAILSFTRPGQDMSFYNAVGGVVMGGLCLAVCLYMFARFCRAGNAKEKEETE